MLFKLKTNNFIFNCLLACYFVISFFSLIMTKANNKNENKVKSEHMSQISKAIQLDDTNFTEFNKTNSKFFLYFYEGNCKKCDRFNPIYDKSSFLASQSVWKIPHAKVNLDKAPKLKAFYEIESVPEIFWVNYDEHDFYEYTGSKNAKAMIKFVNHALNYTTEELVKYEHLEAKKKVGTYLIFIGDIIKFKKIYEKVVKIAKEEDIHVLLWSNADEIFDKFNINKNSFDVVLLKKKKNSIEINGKLNIQENASIDEIQKLLEIYSRKAFDKLSDTNLYLSTIYDPLVPSVLYIYNSKDKNYAPKHKETYATLDKLSKIYRRDFHFLRTTFNNELAISFVKVFSLKPEQLPVLVLINDNPQYEDDVEKYIFPQDKELNEENIVRFLEDFQAGKLNKFLYSEQLPEKPVNENNFYNLVAYNYEDFLFKSNQAKDIVLFLYTDSSIINHEYFKDLEGLSLKVDCFKRVAQKLKYNGNLLFAHANPILNEMRLIKHIYVPTIFLIRGLNYEERVKNMVEFELQPGNFTTSLVIEFIKQNVYNPITSIEALENEDSILAKEKEYAFEKVLKEQESMDFDYDGVNLGLRRFVKLRMDEEDEDYDDEEEENEEYFSDQKQKNTRAKDDL